MKDMYLRCEVSHSTVKTNLPLTLKSRRDHRASFFTNLPCRQLKRDGDGGDDEATRLAKLGRRMGTIDYGG